MKYILKDKKNKKNQSNYCVVCYFVAIRKHNHNCKLLYCCFFVVCCLNVDDDDVLTITGEKQTA